MTSVFLSANDSSSSSPLLLQLLSEESNRSRALQRLSDLCVRCEQHLRQNSGAYDSSVIEALPDLLRQDLLSFFRNLKLMVHFCEPLEKKKRLIGFRTYTVGCACA
eukprot:TRINITY_DN3285_c0_g1_i1.p1 TRINITY_DN3285_c0_g1~~TRINITY_DN3285_c0_g1_i1.p1  ORF type:complete len:117 (-),score=16.78 TRINITY_DN3285_c0_g1_i1:13-330(-)